MCHDLGTIQTIKWITDESYKFNGEPIPFQSADVKLCECQNEKIFDKYNASSGMKPDERERTFETAIIDNENRGWFLQCQKFVESIDDHLKAGSWLYLTGDDERAKKEGKAAFGTGKSYLTHCIGNYLTQKKYKAIYVTEDKLFEEIKNTYNKGSEETESEVLFRYQNVPILLIDDLFKSKTTEWTEDKLFHLLNNRQVPGKVTIINSNYATNRIELTMPRNGRAIASRIVGQAIMIEMIGTDRRREAAKVRYLRGIDGGKA